MDHGKNSAPRHTLAAHPASQAPGPAPAARRTGPPHPLPDQQDQHGRQNRQDRQGWQGWQGCGEAWLPWLPWLGLAASVTALTRFATRGFAPDGRF
ncbi:hypothetical protein ACWEQ3_51050, partial [Streptomyces mirabilis]